ncbi:AAA family ATPase, partial [Flavobacteriaceae bacterium]|nr:AAA family ATPase [Flavobacteriaceae bacterium]
MFSKTKADDLLKNTSLNEGQKKCAKLILNTKNQLSLIQGYAGTGKTYMLSEVKNILDQESKSLKTDNKKYELFGLAPTGSAVKELKSAGINSITLQSFLKKYDGYANNRGTKENTILEANKYQNKIILVDESSMISRSDMKNLLTIANRLNLKITLLGDIHQLQAIQAGKPFEQVESIKDNIINHNINHNNNQQYQQNNIINKIATNIKTIDRAIMTDIIRQKDDNLKQAVHQSINKNINEAFNKLGTNVIEICDDKKHQDPKITTEEKRNDISDAVIKLHHKISTELSNNQNNKINNNTSDILITTSSNDLRKIINHSIRENLNISNDHQLSILTQKGETIEQRSISAIYHDNDVILLNKSNSKFGIKKGD